MTGGLPAPIDRDALERILKRATELQAGERDPGHDLSDQEVMALGREVGLPARYLQQALLEERARVGTSPASGILGRLAGPGEITAQRVVQGETERVQAAIVAYMSDSELLVVQREQQGSILWEPLGGIQAAIRRSSAALGRNSRGYLLHQVSSIRGTIASLETGYVHVALTADLRGVRGGYVGGGAALLSAGVAGAAILLSLGAFAPIAIAPIALGTGLGYGTVRQYPARVERVTLGLERALDHLEQNASRRRQLPPRTGVGTLLADELRRMIR